MKETIVLKMKLVKLMRLKKPIKKLVQDIKIMLSLKRKKNDFSLCQTNEYR